MSPTIRIDDEVFGALQRRAEAFVDSPNDVLRRLLGLNHSRGPARRRSRAPAGSVTPEGAYRPLILRALADSGGSAPRRAVLDAIKREMDGRFKAKDLERTATGAIVWETWASWERANMVKEDLLKSDSPHGTWELSSSGLIEARKLGTP